MRDFVLHCIIIFFLIYFKFTNAYPAQEVLLQPMQYNYNPYEQVYYRKLSPEEFPPTAEVGGKVQAAPMHLFLSNVYLLSEYILDFLKNYSSGSMGDILLRSLSEPRKVVDLASLIAQTVMSGLHFFADLLLNIKNTLFFILLHPQSAVIFIIRAILQI